MNIKHIFSFAVLAVMTAACSSEDLTQQPASQSGQTLPFRATISAYSDTRGLTEATDGLSITAKWVVGEQIALVHGKTVDVMDVKTVDNTTGNATIDGELHDYEGGETVYLVYVGSNATSMSKFKTRLAGATTTITEDMIKAKFVITGQKGTLKAISEDFDYRLNSSPLTLTVTNINAKDYATFATPPTLDSQFSIWKLTLTTDGTTPLAASKLDITCGTSTYTIDRTSTTSLSEFYVLLPASFEATYKFKATDGTNNYTVTYSGVSLENAKFYRSTLTMAKILQAPGGTSNYTNGGSQTW